MIPRFDQANRSYLQYVQRLRKYALRLGLVVGVCALFLTDSRWRVEAPAFHDLIVRVGILLILLCIAGRTWCTLYIGGLKKVQLVTLGPYSLVRNPLYVFTIIGVAGVGAQTGSITMAVGLALLVAIVFYAVALQEQAFLADTFGGSTGPTPSACRCSSRASPPGRTPTSSRSCRSWSGEPSWTPRCSCSPFRSTT